MPQCGSPCLLEKRLKTGGHIAVCPNKECKYLRELAPVETAAV